MAVPSGAGAPSCALARKLSPAAPGNWRTVVRCGAESVGGCSDAWHAGRVDTVDGIDAKCALLLREAGPGDRILLPRAWQEALPAGFAEQLRAQGASVACVERIGII
jgi:hypothetical protein